MQGCVYVVNGNYKLVDRSICFNYSIYKLGSRERVTQYLKGDATPTMKRLINIPIQRLPSLEDLLRLRHM